MTHATMTAVTIELKRRGIDATVEFPGVIHVEIPVVGARHLYGDANETIMGDVYDQADDGRPIESLDSEILSNSSDYLRIADWITCNYTTACGVAYEVPPVDTEDPVWLLVLVCLAAALLVAFWLGVRP